MTAKITLHEGDNRIALRRLIDQGVRVHSVATDAPYGLVSVTKRFGGEDAAPAKFGTDGAFSRASAGFMGSKWDGTGIERDPAFWRLIYDILLPGGYVAAFSSARTGHWQACAMETAGFVMHPFKGWIFGSGFPKDYDLERAIAVERCSLPGRHYKTSLPEEGKRRKDDHICPSCNESEAWAGWSYGTQSCKPALEPIYIAQKPFSERNGARNVLAHGVGGLNIDACRVHADDAQGGAYTIKRLLPDADINKTGSWKSEREFVGYQKPGRHPANLLHDGSDEVLALFPSSPGQIAAVGPANGKKSAVNVYGDYGPRTQFEPRNDSGSAARFFNCFPPEGGPVFYQGKASKADRAGSEHPTVKPIALMRWLCRLITPPGGTVLDPFAGSGATAEAARREGFDCILMEAEPDYVAFLRRRFDLPVRRAMPADIVDLLGSPMDRDLAELLG